MLKILNFAGLWKSAWNLEFFPELSLLNGIHREDNSLWSLDLVYSRFGLEHWHLTRSASDVNEWSMVSKASYNLLMKQLNSRKSMTKRSKLKSPSKNNRSLILRLKALMEEKSLQLGTNSTILLKNCNQWSAKLQFYSQNWILIKQSSRRTTTCRSLCQNLFSQSMLQCIILNIIQTFTLNLHYNYQ